VITVNERSDISDCPGNEPRWKRFWLVKAIGLLPVFLRQWRQFIKSQSLLMIAALLLLIGCTSANQTVIPEWIDRLIEQIENDPVGNPPLSVWRYEYKGQEVYFVPAHCCDIPGILFDTEGNVICEPDGGIKGVGDERCSDFFDLRTHEQLIWQDTR
jgi:hypothetical protein